MPLLLFAEATAFPAPLVPKEKGVVFPEAALPAAALIFDKLKLLLVFAEGDVYPAPLVPNALVDVSPVALGF